MVKFITRYLTDRTLSLEEYMNMGGFTGLKNALKAGPQQVIEEVKATGLRGRGGAYFPTGIKWTMVAGEKSEDKYVICNADEGEPGTFKDKGFLYSCPYQIIEGMVIAALAIGSEKGFIYVRGEYENSSNIIEAAVEDMRKANLLGKNILAGNLNFDIEVRRGAGAYVCGEETALIESIEGKKGIPRLKPPFPGQVGLWGKPTLINNVETFANIPIIMEVGPDKYNEYGTDDCKGTKLVSVSGIVKKKGVYEIPFGTSMKEIIYDICGGIDDGKSVKFIQLGGLTGRCMPPDNLEEIKIDIDGLKEKNLTLGSGAIHVVDQSVDMMDYLQASMKFFEHESCGRCVPCREGNRHLVKIVEEAMDTGMTDHKVDKIMKITNVMKSAAACGLGQAAPTVLESLMDIFESEFKSHDERRD